MENKKFDFKETSKKILAYRKSLPFLIAFPSFWLCAFIVFAILGIVFAYQNNDTYIVFLILSSICICFLLAFVGLLIYGYKRGNNELEDATENFLDQIDSLDAGRIKLLNKDYKSKSLLSLQHKINTLAARLNERNDDIDEPVIIEKTFTEEEFPAALRNTIKNSSSFTSALVAIDTVGSNKIPDGVDDTLMRSIKLIFSPTIVCKKKNGSYLLFVEKISTVALFRTRCEQFIRSFAITDIKSESGLVIFYSSKVGAAIFPSISESKLIDTAEAALKKANPLEIIDGGEELVLPYAGIGEKPRRAILLSANEFFYKHFLLAKNEQEMIETVSKALAYYCSAMQFSNAGVLLYNEMSDTYSVVIEHSNTGNTDETGITLFDNSKNIPGRFLNPIFDRIGVDSFFFVDDVNLLPFEVSEMMQSIDAKSGFFFPMSCADGKKGLAYFLSTTKKSSQDLLERECADSFFSMIAVMIIGLDSQKQIKRHQSTLNSLIERDDKLLYSIDNSTYRLMQFSDNMAKKFDNIKNGEYCYKAIMGLDEPCDDCPLRKGTLKKSIPQLGPTEQSMSVLMANKGKGSNISTIIIEGEARVTSSSTNLFDKALGIYNAKTFSNEINREIRTRGNGIVLTMRITNLEDLVARYRLDSKETLLQSVVSLIQDEGYGNILYRFDDTTLAFMLKSMNKNGMFAFAEEIAQLFERPIQAGGSSLTLKLAYSSVAYPNEAQTNFEMVSLLGSELTRSKEMGEGYLLEVGRNKARKANRKQYILQLLQESLAHNQVEMRLSSLIDTPSKKTAGIEFTLGLKGYFSENISKREFLPIAANNYILDKLDFQALNNVKEFYKNYADTILKAKGIKHLCLTMSLSSVLSSSFLENIQKFAEDVDMPKKTLIIAIETRSIVGLEDNLARVIKAASAFGILFSAHSYDVNSSVSAEKLHEIGFTYVRISHQTLQNAMASQSANTSFIRMAAELDEKKLVPIVNRVTDQDQAQFCLDLAMPYYVDGEKGNDLTEQEFITYLNYKK